MRIVTVKSIEDLKKNNGTVIRKGLSGAETHLTLLDYNKRLIEVTHFNSYGYVDRTIKSVWDKDRWIVLTNISFFWHNPNHSVFRNKSLLEGYLPYRSMKIPYGVKLSNWIEEHVNDDIIQSSNVQFMSASEYESLEDKKYYRPIVKEARDHPDYTITEELLVSWPGKDRVSYMASWRSMDCVQLFPGNIILIPEAA